MLNFKSVSGRNFLSYGDIWTDVDLYKGINLVTGYDNQKKRSNGAGKTSFMEMIMFALFGQVSKGLKQSQIINWKNKKKCEVKCVFQRGGHEYMFHRGLKPNFLKVSKDGNEYPINSSVKDFQIECEEQIIGMDFKTFNSLIYSNPNNSISILDTPKAQKRAFIEKQFNLTEFSDLNKINNEMIRDTEKERDSLLEQDKSKLYIIDTLEKDIKEIEDSIKAIDISQIKKDIGKLEQDLLKIEIDQDDIDKLTSLIKEKRDVLGVLDKEIKNKNEKKNDLKQELIGVLSTITALKKQKENIGDISEYIKKADSIKKKIDLYGDMDEDSKIEKDTRKIEYNKNLDNLNKTYQEHTDIINDLKSRIKSYSLGIKEGQTKCPTCFQDVDYDSIKKTIDEKIDTCKSKIESQLEVRSVIEKGIKDYEDSIKKIDESIKNFENRKQEKNKKELELAKLQSYIDKEKDLDKIDKEISELSKKLYKKKDLEELSNDIKKLEDDLSIKESDIDKLYDKLSVYKDDIDERNDLSRRVDILKERLRIQLENLDSYNKRVKIKKSDVDKNKKESLNIKEKVKDMDISLEHFKFTKDMLKDENIKQFAISHMIPIIEKYVNYYLGEAGFSFYLKLDNWLDADIKGPGMGDCSFASMSGGERKSIDLALKFAIIDIGIARNPDFPDILILDELLDSSVDTYGIQQLVEVVKVKQKKHNLKVYIVSHRQEIENLEHNYQYDIIKDKGFSKITIK